MTDDHQPVTVRARIRSRISHDDDIPTEHRWDQETADSYQQGRDLIRARLPESDLVIAWHVDQPG